MKFSSESSESSNIEDRREGEGGEDRAVSSDPRKPFGEQPEGYAGHGLSSEAGFYDVGVKRGQKGEEAKDSGIPPMKGGFVGEYKQGGPVVDPRAKQRDYPKKSPFKL